MITLEEKKLIHSFKRMIHILSTGKNRPINYGSVELYRAEVHILEIIQNFKGITATEITQKMDITKGAVSQIIKKLIVKDLIYKNAKKDNLKIQELYLTKSGIEVYNFHHLKEKELLVSLKKDLQRVNKNEINTFSKIVDQISDFIKDE